MDRWQPPIYCKICFKPIDQGKLCKSCYTFIKQKQQEEKRLFNENARRKFIKK